MEQWEKDFEKACEYEFGCKLDPDYEEYSFSYFELRAFFEAGRKSVLRDKAQKHLSTDQIDCIEEDAFEAGRNSVTSVEDILAVLQPMEETLHQPRFTMHKNGAWVFRDELLMNVEQGYSIAELRKKLDELRKDVKKMFEDKEDENVS